MSSPRLLMDHPVVRAEAHPVRTSAGVVDYVRLRMPDWVNVVALTEAQELVLVRQHRFGVDRVTLEIPGGSVDPGEAPQVAAARELLEETGYGGGSWRPMGFVWSNPAIQDNRTWLYLAEGVTRQQAPELGPGEESLTVELHPWGSLPGLLDAGEVDHALAVVSLERALRRRRAD